MHGSSTIKRSSSQENLLLVAAGAGRRYGGLKQFEKSSGLPLLFHAFLAFCPHVDFDHVVIVLPEAELQSVKKQTDSWFSTLLQERHECQEKKNKDWLRYHREKIAFVAGGNERWYSVEKGLAKLACLMMDEQKNSDEANKVNFKRLKNQNSRVWIHDAVRPLLHTQDVLLLRNTVSTIAKTTPFAGIVPCHKIVDTIKKVSLVDKLKKNKDDWRNEQYRGDLDSANFDRESIPLLEIKSHANRQEYRAISTPQVFPFVFLQAAYRFIVELNDARKAATASAEVNLKEEIPDRIAFQPILQMWQKIAATKKEIAEQTLQQKKQQVYQQAIEMLHRGELTDDAALYQLLGGEVFAFEIEHENPKLTHASQLTDILARLKHRHENRFFSV